METKKKNNKILEHKYFILDCEQKNRNHRYYPKSVIDKWIEHDDMKSEIGIDVEYAVDDNAEINNEYLQDSLSCAKVIKLEFEGTKLWGTVKFKKNNLTDAIYSGSLKVEDLSVVPKGKGSVKNQRVQDDFELYGFNLVKIEESSFSEEEKKPEETVAE